MNTETTTNEITIGSNLRITKGCKALGITKGDLVQVTRIESPSDDPHAVWITLAGSSKLVKSMYVRYRKRLSDPVIRAHTGNPLNYIEFKRK